MNSNLKGRKKSKAAEERKSCVNVLVAVLNLLSKRENKSAEIDALADVLLFMERTGELEKFIEHYGDDLRSL